MKARLESGLVTLLRLATVVLMALAVTSEGAESRAERTVVLKAGAATGGDTGDGPKTTEKQKRIIIQALEPAGLARGGERREVAWLGLATEESTEALTAQLGLNSGEGLVVTYVATESPAAKAGLQKNDVLVEFDRQTLVHPAQFRKLVQMRKEGDAVKLTFYRGGKKDDVSVNLGKTTLSPGLLQDEHAWQGDLRELRWELGDLPGGEKMRDEMRRLHEDLAEAGVDRKSVQVEVKRSLEEARKAVQEAARQATNAQRRVAPAVREMEALAEHEVDVDQGATIVVKSRRTESMTMVKSDDTGTYIVVADPGKHLTARDKNGKTIFEGEIESPEQQKRVPKELWEKVQPMIEQLDKDKGKEPQAGSDRF